MSPVTLEAVFYVREAPEFEFKDGLVHICQTIGGYRFERVMSPHIFRLTVRRAQKLADAISRGAEIVEFKRNH